MPPSAAAPDRLPPAPRLMAVPVIHEFDPPERFVVGTVGEPGQRTFFIQARAGARMVSVALEKQQVAALAERVDELLDQVLGEGPTETLVPAVAPRDLDDQAGNVRRMVAATDIVAKSAAARLARAGLVMDTAVMSGRH